MDVGVWLRGLGLGQYETAFREGEIDAEILPDLTEGDLNHLGVPLGHRKRLLKAIAAFGTAEGASKPSSPAAASSLTGVAERRPITVMFFDLVGSTPLAAKLDAEDWRDLVGAYLDAASEAVTQMGGRVAKTLGDGLMALFGHPIAQENDSERAIRAALAIQRALVEINARNASRGAPGLSARIGLDSGQVVVDATALATAGFVTILLSRNHEAALNAIDRALASNPSCATALYLAAQVHSILGHSDKATAYANRALRQSPFDLMVQEAYMALGIAAIAETRYEEAASFYARAVQSSPKTSTYYLFHAIALALAGHLDEARPLAERGLELEPQFRVRWLCGMFPRALADKFVEGGRLLALLQ
jgi:class 3 adenylate cyclase